MCRLPVTFGGGSRMEKGSAPGLALAPARKASAASQAALTAGSAVAGVEGLFHRYRGLLVGRRS